MIFQPIDRAHDSSKMTVTDTSVDNVLIMAEQKKGMATAQKLPVGAPSEGYTHNGPGDDAASIMVEDFGNIRPFTPQQDSRQVNQPPPNPKKDTFVDRSDNAISEM